VTKAPGPAPQRPRKTVLEGDEPAQPRPLAALLAQAPVASARLGTGRLVIGREGADLVLDSPVVSRRHALVQRVGAEVVLRDLGSRNGTFVGRGRMAAARLVAGSTFRIGPFVLRFDGSHLVAHDTRGAVRLDAVGLHKRVSGGRSILRDVSLAILPRQLVALVGGSGAGKTTLMKALAGQAEPSAGVVLLNGDDLHAHFSLYRSLIGYVPQEDIVHRDLPVRRALGYTARLRLPPDMSRAEIRQRIDRALDEVDLREHAHKRIGQLSGGQRKRVSIAAELLADPSLFFLDEPTSGLDPGLEKKMMLMLRRLAEAGRTVVVVTHSTASLDQCHAVGFVADGRLVYLGPPAQALPFFRVPSGDYADIYGKLEGEADPRRADRMAVARADLAVELSRANAAAKRPHASPSLAELWEAHFRASPLYAEHVVAKLAQAPAARDAARPERSRPPRTSSLRQLAILAVRYLDLMLQDGKNLLILLLQAPLIAYLMTLVASADALTGQRATPWEAKTVLFMLTTVAVWFGVINAAREIAKEGGILRRERLAGLRLGPYLLSKVLVLGLLVTLQAGALIGIVSRHVSLPARGIVFSGAEELYLTTVLTGAAGLALGLCISAFAKTPDRAISAVPIVLIPQILFSGVLFQLGGDTSTIRVLSWLTISRWATDAYGATANLVRFLPLRKVAEYAHTEHNLYTKWGLLGAFALGFTLLTAVLLALRDREG
jgi:ABC transport system ATP-binding/permease protein